MSQMTTAELQELPQKDEWTDDEALALYKDIDGFETCCGAPTPQFVQTTEDRVRWSHCARLASVITGEPASGQLAGMTARQMFQDRQQYSA
jgi:hypothetical protein